MSEDEEGRGAYEDVHAEKHPRLSNLHSVDVAVFLPLEALPAWCLPCAVLPHYEAEVAICQRDSSSAGKQPEVRKSNNSLESPYSTQIFFQLKAGVSVRDSTDDQQRSPAATLLVTTKRKFN
jgi:hypothetical protein